MVRVKWLGLSQPTKNSEMARVKRASSLWQTKNKRKCFLRCLPELLSFYLLLYVDWVNCKICSNFNVLYSCNMRIKIRFKFLIAISQSAFFGHIPEFKKY